MKKERKVNGSSSVSHGANDEPCGDEDAMKDLGRKRFACFSEIEPNDDGCNDDTCSRNQNHASKKQLGEGRIEERPAEYGYVHRHQDVAECYAGQCKPLVHTQNIVEI